MIYALAIHIYIYNWTALAERAPDLFNIYIWTQTHSYKNV